MLKADFFCRMVTKTKHADWEKPADIERTFGTADLLGNSLQGGF